MISQHDQQISYFNNEFKNADFLNMAPWQQSYIKRVWKFMIKKPSSQVLLDVGTGSGYIALTAAKEKLKKVIGVDLTPGSIEKLKEIKKKSKLNNLELILAPAEKTNLASSCVDILVANAILEHIAEESKTIKEWKRVLKPGGRMMVTVPLKFRYMLPFFWPLNYIHDRRIGHLRRYDIDDLKDKFKLEVVDVVYTGHLVKVIGTLANFIIHSQRLSAFLEVVDSKFAQIRYGASNISVIFEK